MCACTCIHQMEKTVYYIYTYIYIYIYIYLNILFIFLLYSILFIYVVFSQHKFNVFFHIYVWFYLGCYLLVWLCYIGSILASLVDLQIFAITVAILSTHYFIHLYFCLPWTIYFIDCNCNSFTYNEQIYCIINIITSIAKTTSKKIGALICSMQFLSPEVALYLYKFTIQPSMEYCCHVCAGAPSYLGFVG